MIFMMHTWILATGGSEPKSLVWSHSIVNTLWGGTSLIDYAIAGLSWETT
jgi:hypothetical protein